MFLLTIRLLGRGVGTVKAIPGTSAYAWGYNGEGELGNGSTTGSNAPVAVSLPAGVSFTALAAGQYHSLALGSAGFLEKVKPMVLSRRETEVKEIADGMNVLHELPSPYESETGPKSTRNVNS